MRYLSTRGKAPVLGFCDAMLAGLASDGGLYLPETYPSVPHAEIAGFAGAPYNDVAFAIMSRFVGGEIADADLKRMIADAYATFAHDAVAPLVQLDANHWLLELFHGPTLAFKDIAMQVLARMMDHVLTERRQRATIVGATSGDTGGAAIEAFRGREAIDIFILHPKGLVSDVQRRQMTTATEANVHNIAIEGNFDDCQAMVKALFNDAGARKQLALSGVNSINWARIMAQTVYYFTAGANLGAPERAASYVVPTGNFGDIFAGYVASRMGLPIDRLVVATNVNDILARALATGRYETEGVTATATPSMDIQVSSNFERLLFEASNRDAATVTRLMDGLKQSGAFTLPKETVSHMRKMFDAARADEAEVAAAMRETLAHADELVDPHTAVGLSVASRMETKPGTPVVTLATAHPAKFPAAVADATGQTPPTPARLGDLFAREERLTVLNNDYTQVLDFISTRSRAVKSAAPGQASRQASRQA